MRYSGIDEAIAINRKIIEVFYSRIKDNHKLTNWKMVVYPMKKDDTDIKGKITDPLKTII